MQKQVAKIIVLCALSVTALAANLQTADSLFQKRQYTQAYSQYREIFDQGKYSPAMLLKMAYIQEGLGHLGDCLFYLNIYVSSTHDESAIRKMAELAEKNGLEGYASDPSREFYSWMAANHTTITLLLAATAFLMLGFVVYEARKRQSRPTASFILLSTILLVMLWHNNNETTTRRALIDQPQTYLMSGPSAGANVIAVVGEGHLLPIRSEEDVWIEIKWKEGSAYVKRSRVVIL